MYIFIGNLGIGFFQKFILHLFSIFLHMSEVWWIHVWLHKQAAIMWTWGLTYAAFNKSSEWQMTSSTGLWVFQEVSSSFMWNVEARPMLNPQNKPMAWTGWHPHKGRNKGWYLYMSGRNLRMVKGNFCTYNVSKSGQFLAPYTQEISNS